RDLYVLPARTVARLAIDLQRREARLVIVRDSVVRHVDLTAMTLLARLELIRRAEYARRRPIGTIRQRQRGRDWHRAFVGAPERIAEPAILGLGEVERHEAHG